MKFNRFHAGALGVAAALSCAGTAVASTGPSSSDAPYVIPSRPGVVTKSILTVGDSADNGYRMAGIPDGLGAFDNGDGTFTLLSDHELRPAQGIARAHGGTGAFVSKWTIDADTLQVKSGADLIQTLREANGDPITGDARNINRLCSADLPDYTAFFNPATGTGYDGRIFMSGEEATGGRAFAHVVTGTDAGTSYHVPIAGEEWENLVANPATGDKTVVAGTEDSTGGEIVLYQGQKQNTGNAAERAGLTNGTTSAIKVDGVSLEDSANGIPSGTRFSLAAKDSGTGFQRPEDISWDPTNPNVVYFVTTNGFTAPSRLWRLTFDDINNPAAGGEIDELVEGPEGGHKMFDNITVSNRGQVIIQEDPGNQAYVARVWRYYPDTDKLTEVAHFDNDLFSPASDDFITQDEESSGVIDASGILGDGWFLFDDQVHKTLSDPELVERGQYQALHVPPGQK
jgi:hypothetical protein